MAFESLARCLLIWITIAAGLASGLEFDKGIKAAVPTCAQPCLQSFIAGNYASTDCTKNPTLECMCSEKSTSGYTIGEGALQCISAEAERGICSGKDVSGSVKHDAYLMCSKIPNALPNTHAVLTATVVNSPTGAPASLAPPSPTSTQTSAAANGAATTSSGSLNGGQIAGIVVGILAIILIVLVVALVIRRRRMGGGSYRGLEGGTPPPMSERSRPETPKSNNFFAAQLRRFSDRKPNIQVPPPHQLASPRFPASPLPPRIPPNPAPSPSPFLTPTPSQESLALPRSLNSTPTMSPKLPAHRPLSRLLPAKPAIGSDTPPPRPAPPPKDLFKSAENLSRESSSRTQRTKTSLLTNMTGVAPVYIADKWGNWVLNNKHRESDTAKITQVAELDTYTPMTKAPIEKNEERTETIEAAVLAAYGAPQKPQLAFLSQEYPVGRLNRSSSVYSQDSRHNSRFAPYRNNSFRSRTANITQRNRSDTAVSTESFTTINSYSTNSSDEEVPFELDNTHLSHPPTPKESSTRAPTPEVSQAGSLNPPGRPNRTLLQIDPMKRTSFSSSPPGQPSPTLKGHALIPRDSGSPYPQPLKPRRTQTSQTTNSKNSVDSETELAKPPRIDDSRPPIQSPLSRFSPRIPNDEAWFPDRLQTPPAQIPGTESPPPPQIDRHLTPSPMSSRSASGDAPRPHIARAVSPLSHSRTNPDNVAASSLLAKRLGNGKAATLAIAPNSDKLSPNTGLGSLPATPTWQPKLTPTRHGEDLYLSVQ